MRVGVVLVAVVAGCSGDNVRVTVDAPAGDGPTGDTGSPIIQSGCAPGEKCVLAKAGSPGPTTCVPDGSVPLGGACTEEPDTCERGTMCRNGVCRGFCAAWEDFCSVGLCSESGLGLCSVSCDPTNDTCPAGTECYLPLGAEHETPGCLPVGTRMVGEFCVVPNQCASGLTCADEASDPYGACTPRCIVGQSICPPQTTCRERHTGDGYGVCLP